MGSLFVFDASHLIKIPARLYLLPVPGPSQRQHKYVYFPLRDCSTSDEGTIVQHCKEFLSSHQIDILSSLEFSPPPNSCFFFLVQLVRKNLRFFSDMYPAH